MITKEEAALLADELDRPIREVSAESRNRFLPPRYRKELIEKAEALKELQKKLRKISK